MRIFWIIVVVIFAGLTACTVSPYQPPPPHVSQTVPPATASAPPSQPSSPVSASPATTSPAPAPTGLLPVHDPGHVTGTLTGPCHVRGTFPYQLPDPSCTPGSIDPAVTQENIHQTICVSGYTAKIRPPADATDNFKYSEAYPAYGLPLSVTTELDHYVPLELGGSNSARNLWPEPDVRTPNLKDSTENFLAHAVCAGKVPLAAAQNAIATDWVTAEKTLGLK
jgi:hypothetical protein